MPSTTLDLETARFLRAVRDAHFADGLRCVHCQSARVHRWGYARGRQRYRCRDCGRTFSDLTATPYYYSKRLRCWPRFMVCMESSATVRACATLLRLHPCTTFRWRHRVLESVLQADASRLSGVVELTWTRMWHSTKGQPRQHAQRFRIHVLWARDRRGRNIASWHYGRRYGDHFNALSEIVDPGAFIITDEGPLSGAGRFARTHGSGLARCSKYPSDQPTSSLNHLDNVRAQVRRTRSWLPRFRGVATKYLDNYLIWHRCLDQSSEEQTESRWIRATSILPTHPANSTAAAAREDPGTGAANKVGPIRHPILPSDGCPPPPSTTD